MTTRPALRWHGGKWLLAPWIISHFPAHRVYVEPFGGAASVLLRKDRAYAEIYNDLDRRLVSFFRVLRDKEKAARLVRMIELTPFSRAEFAETLEPSDDDVEDARRYVSRSFMGFGSNAAGRSTGFRADSKKSAPAHHWVNYPDGLRLIIERLRGVVIENRPAIDVMRKHDSKETLHYVDPPYVFSTRADLSKDYEHELSDDDHADLLAFLRTLKGFVVLSGYPSVLYDEALKDWHRVERAALADGAAPRTEVLWINPACAQKHGAFGLFEVIA